MATDVLRYFRVAIASILLTSVAGGCSDTGVGLTDENKVPDRNITASSEVDATTAAKNGRLNYTAGSAWCASSRDPTPYLQVDMGSVYIICAVATQGNFRVDQWVKTYQVQYSTDGGNWTVYKEKGENKTFQGNYDKSSAVTRLLYEGIQAQFIRVYPKTHYGGICLRLEIYGLTKQVCEKTAVGISDKVRVPDYRFSASSSFAAFYRPHHARLSLSAGWATTSAGRSSAWLKIDLGSAYILCAIATKGSGHHNYEWVIQYKIKFTMDNNQWLFYEEGNQPKLFTGNIDKDTLKTNVLKQMVQVKFVKILPTVYHNWPTLRVELYGVVQACASSLGIENNGINDVQLTASSGSANNSRLYNTAGSWCSSTLANMEYIQVDLGNLIIIRGLATQGDVHRRFWTKAFSVAFSYDKTTWFNVTDNQSSLKMFPTSNNQSGVRANWIHYPFVARYVRIYPQTWEVKPCLRFDIYGCRNGRFYLSVVK